jgi:hypothetical protein
MSGGTRQGRANVVRGVSQEYHWRQRGDFAAACKPVASVKHQVSRAIAAAAFILLISCGMTHADPMRCSAEQKACTAGCGKLSDLTAARICITNCAQRQVACRRTGCWDNGSRTYCGLLRQ